MLIQKKKVQVATKLEGGVGGLGLNGPAIKKRNYTLLSYDVE